MPTPPPDTATGVHARELRVTRRIGCALAVVFVALATWLVMRDDPPPEDADLLPPPIAEVPLSESVYGALLEAVAELPESRDWNYEAFLAADEAGVEYREPWGARPLDRSTWSSPERAAERDAYYAEVSPKLDRIAASLERPQGGWPPLPTPSEETGIDATSSARRHLESRALHLRAKGDLAGAAADLDALRSLGESMLSEGPRSWVQGIIACGLVRLALTGQESLLHDGDLPSSFEAAILEHAPILDRDPDTVARCFRHEYAFMKQNLIAYEPSRDPLADGSPWFLDLFFKPNRTLASYARALRQDIAQIEIPPPLRSPAEEWTEEGALRRAILSANSGEWLISQGMAQGPMILGLFDRLRLSGRALRTLVALRRYERERGALPPDLAALVAALPALERVPVDPYSGAPLRYDPARRILWSVGEDGVDGDGDGWEELRDDPETGRFDLRDYVWPIPPVPGG